MSTGDRTGIWPSSPAPAASVQRTRAHIVPRPVRLAALRAPLAVKVIGAHLGVLAVLGIFLMSAPAGGWATPVLLGGMVILAAVYVVLVVVALRPIRDLESAAWRVWRGDYGARVDASSVADQDVLRVGAMFNLLLDGLIADRARMRTLASEIIKAGDRERALLARELHDSTAQQLAALMIQVGAAARDWPAQDVKGRLELIRDDMQNVLEEVRTLSHTVHPRVLDDLGLPAAIQNLAREVEASSELEVEVFVPRTIESSAMSASVLYRVAQEALRNVVRHANAKRASISFDVKSGLGTLTITDDGRGFDIGEAERRRRGMGIFSMRERVELVDGRFILQSEPGKGATVVAIVPLAEETPAFRHTSTGIGDS